MRFRQPDLHERNSAVRSAVEHPAVADHRRGGPVPVLVAALGTQAVPPDVDRA
jgi:hypothetical protein